MRKTQDQRPTVTEDGRRTHTKRGMERVEDKHASDVQTSREHRETRGNTVGTCGMWKPCATNGARAESKQTTP